MGPNTIPQRALGSTWGADATLGFGGTTRCAPLVRVVYLDAERLLGHPTVHFADY